MADRFADLDELLLLCRSSSAKKNIDEAARAYRAGAFRASIVMTWIAVVYDIVDKLRQLDLTGDKKAAQRLAEFESAHKNKDFEAALRFEREIIGVAKADFELITPVEEIDLLRLRDDRNRCAHPSIAGSPMQIRVWWSAGISWRDFGGLSWSVLACKSFVSGSANGNRMR